MCTLCLCDMGELRDEWLREPKPDRSLAKPSTIAAAPSPLRELALVAHVAAPVRVTPTGPPMRLASVA